MNKHLIKQVQARKACIVFGKGDSLINLKELLTVCFPNDICPPERVASYYWAVLDWHSVWTSDLVNSRNLPEIKLSAFFIEAGNGTTSINITYKDITMEVTGDYYAGSASTSRDVPNDEPTFTIDTVTVGGVDISNVLDLQKIEEITLETF